MTDCQFLFLSCVWWSDFSSNLFATLIGVGIGIPIALYINRKQINIQQDLENKIQRKEQAERAVKIVDLLESELQVNLFQLGANKSPSESGMSRVIFVSGFKDELWKVFSEGGEIEWIKDIEILDSLATSYHYIARLKFLENLYFEIDHQPTNVTDLRTPSSLKELTQNLGDLDGHTTTSLENTVKKLREYRDRLHKKNA